MTARDLVAPVVGAVRHLPATPATTSWGRLPCAADAPVLTVEPGERWTVDTVSHEGILEDQGRDPIAFFGAFGVAPDQVMADAVAIAAHSRRDPGAGPHVVTGPIAVRGARAGDHIAVHVEELVPRAGHGIISSRHGKGLLPGSFPLRGPLTSVFCSVGGLDGPGPGYATMPLHGRPDAPSVRFPLAPFLGIMGVATPGSTGLGSTAPGPFGGNIDIALLRTGTTLYLPVQVPEAGFYVGDPHYAQGNGEIALTALEAPLRATLRVDVVPQARARELFGAAVGPIVRTPDYLVPTGLDRDLDEAVAACGRNALEVLGASFGMAPEQAYAYLSAATDFDISQVVDVVKGVHARIRISDFAGLEATPW